MTIIFLQFITIPFLNPRFVLTRNEIISFVPLPSLTSEFLTSKWAACESFRSQSLWLRLYTHAILSRKECHKFNLHLHFTLYFRPAFERYTPKFAVYIHFFNNGIHRHVHTRISYTQCPFYRVPDMAACSGCPGR
jgi:hypothetical protein